MIQFLMIIILVLRFYCIISINILKILLILNGCLTLLCLLLLLKFLLKYIQLVTRIALLMRIRFRLDLNIFLPSITMKIFLLTSKTKSIIFIFIWITSIITFLSLESSWLRSSSVVVLLTHFCLYFYLMRVEFA